MVKVKVFECKQGHRQWTVKISVQLAWTGGSMLWTGAKSKIPINVINPIPFSACFSPSYQAHQGTFV